MKKLLHIVESTATGTLSVLLDLCALQSKYYEITVAYGVRPDTPVNVEDLFHHISPAIRLYRVEDFTRSIRPDKDIKAFRTLKHLVLTWKPDIVHLHSSKAGAVGRLLLLSRRVRYGLNKRKDGSFSIFYTPHGYGFLQSTDSSFHCFIYYMAEWLLGKLKVNTIACSKWEYEETKKLSSRAYYVNNGVHTEELDSVYDLWHHTEVDRKKPDAMSENIRALMKGLEKWRRLGVLLVYISGRITAARNPALFNRIAGQCPDIQFLWIGDGECKSLLTADNITVTGWVSRQDSIVLASMTDVFLLPSLWEGLSISLLEAMYLRKLCVVSDIPQNCAVIAPGLTGCVCHAEADYVRILKEIADGSKAAGVPVSEMADNAHQRIAESFTRQHMAQGYMDIYEERIDRA